ncbi:MAG: tetratricopeptide repeat protein [Bacteroidota bacterium]
MNNLYSQSKSIAFLILILGSQILYGQGLDTKLQKVDNLFDRNDILSGINEINSILGNTSLVAQLSPLQKANLYNNLGFAQIKIKQFDLAKKNLETALTIYEGNPDIDKKEMTFVHQNLGAVLIEEGEYDKARDLLIKSIDEAASAFGQESQEYGAAQTKLGTLFEEVGYYDLAIEYFTKSYNLSVKIHNERSPEYAEICNHLGRIMIKNGNINKAKEYLQKSTQIYEGLGSNYQIDYAESLEDLGMFYEADGNYAEAERVLLRTMDLKKNIPGLPEHLIVETLNDLGILYQDLGNFNKAEQYFAEVHTICIDHLGTDNQYYATSINNLAVIYKRKGQFDEAKALLLEALPVYEKRYGKRHPSYADALNNLASTERILGNFTSAERSYLEVLQIDEQVHGKNHPDYATTLNNLGILYSAMSQPEKAIGYYLESLKIRKDRLGVNHPAYSRSLENVGLHFFAKNDYVLAEKYFREAIQIQIDQISSIFPIQTEREKELFYEDIREDIERYNFVVIRLLQQKPELIAEVLNNQIQTKAILFSSNEKLQNSISNSGNHELMASYIQWKELKTKLASYYQIGKTRLEEYNINLQVIEDSVENMEKNIMLSSQKFSNYLRKDKVTWKEVQSKIKADESVIEIIRIRDFVSGTRGGVQAFGFSDALSYLVIIVKPGSSLPEYELIENGVQLEEKLYAAYKNALQFGFEESASYQLVWERVDKHLNGTKKLYMSPDGIFYKINPNTFKLPDNTYLIDKYYVSFITNCEDILKGRPAKTVNDAVFFGNPNFGTASQKNLNLDQLPGSGEEIKIASKDLSAKKWQTTIYEGDNATEARIKEINSPKILHIATHGYFSDQNAALKRVLNTDNPLFKSGLFLQGAATSLSAYASGTNQVNFSDGILSSYEAMNLNLDDTELVVLSACETGLGDVTNGEGVYGLQRAFLVAGTKYLITSLVKVDDKATQELMNTFYINYLKSNNITESLYQAQVSLRQNYPKPLVWGSFILVGHG